MSDGKAAASNTGVLPAKSWRHFVAGGYVMKYLRGLGLLTDFVVLGECAVRS